MRWTLAFLSFLSATTASAHDFRLTRKLILEPNESLNVLIELSIPAKQKPVFVAFADKNHDGILDSGENEAWKNTLLERAVAGIRLEIDGKELQVPKFETKARIEQRSIEFVALGSLPMSTRSATISVATSPPGGELELWVFSSQRHLEGAKVTEKGLRTKLGARERVTFTVGPKS